MNNTLDFPIQITPVGTEVSDEQLACEVRMLYVHKINEANQGRYELTARDLYHIRTINDIFRRNGDQTIDMDAEYI